MLRRKVTLVFVIIFVCLSQLAAAPSPPVKPNGSTATKTLPNKFHDTPFQGTELDPNMNWSWMLEYFNTQIPRLAQWKWPCLKLQTRAIQCMMTNVMALAFYAQSAEDYWYPFGKLRGTTLSGSNPSLEMQQTGQKISVSALKASTLSIYQSMVSLYNDFLNDNPKSLEPQGIQFSICEEYPFPAQKDWTDKQFTWLYGQFNQIGKETQSFVQRLLSPIDKFDEFFNKFRHSLQTNGRQTPGLSADVICRINAVGIVLHKVNLKQVKKSEIVQSFLLADEETKFYVDKLQKKTNYPKFSQSTDKIKIKPSALFSTIKYHLDEDNKSKGSSGNIQPPQPPAVPAKYYPAMKFGHIELDKGTIFSGSFTINGGIVI